MQGVDSLFVFGTAAFETHAAAVCAVGLQRCVNVQAYRFSAASFSHRGRLLCILPKKEPQPWLRLYSSPSGTSARGSTLVEKTI